MSEQPRGRAVHPGVLGPYLWVTPAILYLLFFWGYPALYALFLSLTNARLGEANIDFTWIANYRRVLRDPVFWTSLRNNAVLLVGSVFLEVFLGAALALYLTRPGNPGRHALTIGLLIPWLFSELVSALTWRWIFHEPFGLLNVLLGKLGIPGTAWLAGPVTAMGALLVVSLWQGIGISSMVVLAALKAVPGPMLDLAAMDGASGWKRLWYVLIPQVKGTLLLDCLLVGIKSLGAFTVVFALTGGGPGYATEIIATYVYRLSFFHYELGYASAVGVCLAVLFLSLATFVLILPRSIAVRGYEGT